jgi:hypothetical protein
VSLGDERTARAGASPDILFVDGRVDLDESLQAVERLRAEHPVAVILFMAAEANPDLILHAMRAGANEFFAWPPSRSALDEALQRAANRRAASPAGKQDSKTIVFFGAKGGAGTTTLAVNFGVDVARLRKRPTLIVDLKQGLGEVTLFLGVRSRYTLLDALDNMHRLDSEFMRELVVKHKSGVEILAGSDLFDRPSSNDTPGLEELFRLLGRQYEYIVVGRRIAAQSGGGGCALHRGSDLPDRVAGRAFGSQRAAAARSHRSARDLGRPRAPAPESRRGTVPDSASTDREGGRPSHLPDLLERLQDRVDGAQLRRADCAGRQQ